MYLKLSISAGVEWDDPGRGKHDGSVTTKTDGKIHRYFACTSGYGSFMKLPLLSKGVEIVEAMDAKYSDHAAEAGGTVTDAESGGEIEVVFVGRDKVR